jgi:hypothetical protein
MLFIFVNHLIGLCYYTKIMNLLSNFLNLLIVFLRISLYVNVTHNYLIMLEYVSIKTTRTLLFNKN